MFAQLSVRVCLSMLSTISNQGIADVVVSKTTIYTAKKKCVNFCVVCDFYYEQKNDVQICITQLGISAKFCIQWPLQGSHSDFPIYLTELSLDIFVWLIGLWSCCILDFISMIY